MNKRIRGVFTPKILIPLLAVGAVGFGAVGVMSLLERRGEAAISMIPSDAVLAVSFDNTPSPSQVMLFKEIANAMEDGGVNRFVDEMMDEMQVPPQVRAIKENLKGSFAVGLWGDMAGGKPDMLLAAALNSTASAENVIRDHAEKISGIGIPAYKVDGEVIIAFYEDYALVTNSEQNLRRAIDAAEGKIQSLDEVAAFKSARESLPSDASFMLFANGETIAQADEDTRKMYEAMGISKAGWAAMSATVVDAGIQLDMYQDMSGAGELTKAYEAIPALTYSSADMLPAGAIGVLAVSDAGQMVNAIVEMVGASELGTEMEEGFADMEKESGMNFEKDFLPALAGETYMALYPPKQGEDEPTFVLMFDEQNGANPEGAARKIIAKEGGFTSKKIGDAEVFSVKADEPVIAILPDQVVITNDPTIISKPTSSALIDTGSLAKFDEGEPAKFKIEIDLRQLFSLMRDSMGKDAPALDQALSQDSLTCTWTVENGVSKGRALIPLKLPELIRIAGKEMQKAKETGAFPPQTADMDPSMEMPMDSMEFKSKDELLAEGKQLGVAFLMFKGDNDGKFPEYQAFLDGALDPYLSDKEMDDDFIYMPPFKDSDPKTTQLGSYLAEGGRVVVFADGRAEYESFEDWGE